MRLAICLSSSLFTGKERDTESGNDYFGARYYASSMGRFLSPDFDDLDDDDPEPVPYADLENPQTLNLYQYVRNNPLSDIDADGHVNEGCHSTSAQGADGKIVITMDCPALHDSGPGPLMSPLDAEIFAWSANKALNAAVWGAHTANEVYTYAQLATSLMGSLFQCSCSQNQQQQNQQQQMRGQTTQGASSPRPKGVADDWKERLLPRAAKASNISLPETLNTIM
jgi:RHS repeat-associated protein